MSFQTLLHPDLPTLVQTLGYIGMFGLVFAETGFFFGFFLPGGDSLLFTAGLLASHGYLDVWALSFTISLAAILGDSVGYFIGVRVGPSLFSREDSLFFHKEHLEKTREFFAKHGPRAVVFGRFIPVVRTFTPLFAGIGRMRYSTFVLYNIVGGIVWGAGLTLLGYYLGTSVPGIQHYIVPIAALIIIISIIPIAISAWRTARNNRAAKKAH